MNAVDPRFYVLTATNAYGLLDDTGAVKFTTPQCYGLPNSLTIAQVVAFRDTNLMIVSRESDMYGNGPGPGALTGPATAIAKGYIYFYLCDRQQEDEVLIASKIPLIPSVKRDQKYGVSYSLTQKVAKATPRYWYLRVLGFEFQRPPYVPPQITNYRITGAQIQLLSVTGTWFIPFGNSGTLNVSLTTATTDVSTANYRRRGVMLELLFDDGTWRAPFIVGEADSPSLAFFDPGAVPAVTDKFINGEWQLMNLSSLAYHNWFVVGPDSSPAIALSGPSTAVESSSATVFA